MRSARRFTSANTIRPANSLWQFREPVATLLVAGKTVGRHYAGPTWEMSDGGAVSAKAVARAPGASANDIPLLKLEVTARHGTGKLGNVTTIQRLNTQGGTADAACDSSGALLSVPYTADYVFYRKAADQSAMNWRNGGSDEHRAKSIAAAMALSTSISIVRRHFSFEGKRQTNSSDASDVPADRSSAWPRSLPTMLC